MNRCPPGWRCPAWPPPRPACTWPCPPSSPGDGDEGVPNKGGIVRSACWDLQMPAPAAPRNPPLFAGGCRSCISRAAGRTSKHTHLGQVCGQEVLQIIGDLQLKQRSMSVRDEHAQDRQQTGLVGGRLVLWSGDLTTFPSQQQCPHLRLRHRVDLLQRVGRRGEGLEGNQFHACGRESKRSRGGRAAGSWRPAVAAGTGRAATQPEAADQAADLAAAPATFGQLATACYCPKHKSKPSSHSCRSAQCWTPPAARHPRPAPAHQRQSPAGSKSHTHREADRAAAHALQQLEMHGSNGHASASAAAPKHHRVAPRDRLHQATAS